MTSTPAGESPSLAAMAGEEAQNTWATVNFSSQSPAPESGPQARADFVKDTHAENLAPGAEQKAWPGHKIGPRVITQKERTKKLAHLQPYISE